MRLLNLLALGSVVLAGCAASPEASVGEGSSELALERVPLPTLRTELTAGDPYSPVLDERPLVIAGAAPCLLSPTVVKTAGTTQTDASIVSTRRDLFDRLDLGIEGVPVDIAQLSGATGTARLAIDTTLAEGTLNLMFQAKGTFESTLTGLGATPPTFDPTRISTCGWGYVRKAFHRISAIVMVTIESSDGTSRVRIGCGEGEANCTPTGIGAGPVQAKLALETMLKKGHFDIHVRSVADVIPGLPPTPLGDIVALSSSPETADSVIDKLDKALDWLGVAQSKIGERIEVLRTDPAAGPAPTVKVDFAHYPGLDSALRERIGRAYDEIVFLRKDYDVTLQRFATWDAFAGDRDAGFAHLYNVPGAPVATVAEMSARADEATGSNGILRARRNDLESRLSACDAAARNERTETNAGSFVAGLEDACKRAPAATWESTYGQRFGLRRLAPLSVVVRTYDEWRDEMCPSGQRIPTREEAPLLAPYSQVSASQGKGLWLRRENIVMNPIYLQAGKVERVGLFQAPEELTACFLEGPSLFD